VSLTRFRVELAEYYKRINKSSILLNLFFYAIMILCEGGFIGINVETKTKCRGKCYMSCAPKKAPFDNGFAHVLLCIDCPALKKAQPKGESAFA